MPQMSCWSSPHAIHIGTPSPKLEPSALVWCGFADESRVSLYHSDFLFLGWCNNPLAFRHHEGTIGHSHYICMGWLWIYQQLSDKTSEDGYSLGLYSLSGKTSYRKISWSLEAARFRFRLFQSLWNLTGTSAAALPRCLSNFRALRLL